MKNKRWAFLLLILSLMVSSLSCGISVDLGPTFYTKTPLPPSATVKPPLPTATNPAPATETATAIPSSTAETKSAVGEQPAVAAEAPVVEPTAQPVPTQAPQAQVISVENSANLTLKRAVGASTMETGLLQRVKVSPDNKSILLVYSTRLILLKMDDLSLIWKVDPGIFLSDITFTKDGSHLISCSPGGSVQTRDVATGGLLNTSIVQRKGVKSMSLSAHGEYFAILDFSDVTTIWDTGTGKQVQDNNGKANPGGISSVVLSPGGGTFMIEGIDSKVRKQVQQWNVTDGKYKIGLLGVLQEMVNWQFSPDAKRIFAVNTRSLTSTPSNVLTAWNASNGALVKAYDSVGLISDYKISPDGANLLIATRDNQLHLLGVETGSKVGSFTGHTGRITGMDFTPDGQGVVSVSADGKLIVWDVVNQKSVKEQTIPPIAPQASMSFSSGGKKAAFLSPDMKKIGILDTASLTPVAVIGPEVSALRAPTISPQGSLVAAMDESNRLNIWDLASGKKLQMIETKTRRPVYKIKITPDEKLIATLSEGQIIVWNVGTGAKQLELAGLNDFDYSPVEKIIASDSTDNRLYLTNVDSGKKLSGINAEHIYSIHYAPGGEVIAIGAEKVQPIERGLVNLVYQVDAHSGERLPVEMSDILGAVSSTAYSPKMDLLAASDSQGNIYLWSLLDGKRVAFFEELAPYPSALSFNSDGTSLFVGSGDGTFGIISTTEAGATSAGAPAATSPGESTLPELSSQPYAHSTGSVTVNLPMGWKLQEPSDVSFVSSESKGIGIVAFLATNTIAPLSDEAFLNYINGCEFAFSSSGTNYKETDRGIDTAKGSGYVTKNITISGVDYIFETYYTRDGSMVIQMNFFTQKPYAESYLSLYQGVYTSLKVNKDFVSKHIPYYELNKYQGTEGKFTYSVPTGWLLDPSKQSDGSSRYFMAPDKTAFLQLIPIPWKADEMTGDTEIFASMQTMLENQEGAVTIVRRDKTDAGDWQISYAVEAKNITGIIIGKKLDATLQTLNVQYSTELDAQYRPLAIKIISSLNTP